MIDAATWIAQTLDLHAPDIGAIPAALRPPRCCPSRTPLLLHLTLSRRLIELLQKLLHIQGLLLCRGLGGRLDAQRHMSFAAHRPRRWEDGAKMARMCAAQTCEQRRRPMPTACRL